MKTIALCVLVVVVSWTWVAAQRTVVTLAVPVTLASIASYTFNEVYWNSKTKTVSVNFIGSDGKGKTWTYEGDAFAQFETVINERAIVQAMQRLGVPEFIGAMVQ